MGDILRHCKKCGTSNWGYWTSSASNNIKHEYCRTCQKGRAKNYTTRIKNAKGSHTHKQWLDKLAIFDACPKCKRLWTEIPPRPNIRYKNVWTKDHILPLIQEGPNDIDNIQPLCYQCNFGKRKQK